MVGQKKTFCFTKSRHVSGVQKALCGNSAESQGWLVCGFLNFIVISYDLTLKQVVQ